MAKHKDFSELFDPSKPMLQVRNLTRLYPQKGGSLFRKPKQVHAVDGVSFTLQEREIFGVIGESGCGKSTLGRLLIRLEEPTSGEIDFYGVSTRKLLDANPDTACTRSSSTVWCSRCFKIPSIPLRPATPSGRLWSGR